ADKKERRVIRRLYPGERGPGRGWRRGVRGARGEEQRVPRLPDASSKGSVSMRIAPLALALSLFALGSAAGAATPVKPPGNDDCLTCHADKDAKRANGKSVFVAKQKFDSSVHGQAGIACVDCHRDLASAKDFPHADRLKKVACATCHDGA